MPETQSIVPRDETTPPYFVGVDLGGTNIKTGIVDDHGKTLAWLSTPTSVPDGPEAGAQRMASAISQAIQEAGLARDEIVRVGLGAPGTMDVPAGMLLHPLNLPGWDDFPIRDKVSEYAGFPVTFSNDANAAAYGEFWQGSGREYSSMVLFTLGTGVGGGIIIGDFAIEGENSHGAELGHVAIEFAEDARVCSCGKRGHVEAYASATGLVNRTRDALRAGAQSSLSALLNDDAELTARTIGEHAEQGDAFAQEIVLETAGYLGRGVVDVLHVVDPSAVILGGAMTFGRDETETGRGFLARVKEEIRARAFPVIAERVRVHYASLGGDAGYIGAAGLARVTASATS